MRISNLFIGSVVAVHGSIRVHNSKLTEIDCLGEKLMVSDENKNAFMKVDTTRSLRLMSEFCTALKNHQDGEVAKIIYRATRLNEISRMGIDIEPLNHCDTEVWDGLSKDKLKEVHTFYTNSGTEPWNMCNEIVRIGAASSVQGV
jgi:hypothetical protein